MAVWQQEMSTPPLLPSKAVETESSNCNLHLLLPYESTGKNQMPAQTLVGGFCEWRKEVTVTDR